MLGLSAAWAIAAVASERSKANRRGMDGVDCDWERISSGYADGFNAETQRRKDAEELRRFFRRMVRIAMVGELQEQRGH